MKQMMKSKDMNLENDTFLNLKDVPKTKKQRK